jgi:hypothetical protein
MNSYITSSEYGLTERMMPLPVLLLLIVVVFMFLTPLAGDAFFVVSFRDTFFFDAFFAVFFFMTPP